MLLVSGRVVHRKYSQKLIPTAFFFFTKDRCAGHGSVEYLQGYEVGIPSNTSGGIGWDKNDRLNASRRVMYGRFNVYPMIYIIYIVIAEIIWTVNCLEVLKMRNSSLAVQKTGTTLILVTSTPALLLKIPPCRGATFIVIKGMARTGPCGNMKRSVQKGATTPTPKPPWCCLGVLWCGVEFGFFALEDILAVKGCHVGKVRCSWVLETCGGKKKTAAEALVIFFGLVAFRPRVMHWIYPPPRMPVAFLSFIRDSRS